MLPKPYPSMNALAWATTPVRRQRLAVDVLAHIVARPAAAGVLVEEVGAERHRVANLAPEQIVDRPPDRLADQVERGDLDRAVDPLRGLKFGPPGTSAACCGAATTRSSASATASGASSRGDILPELLQIIRITPDHNRSYALTIPQWRLTAMRLPQPDNTVFTDQLDHEPQGIRRMETSGIEQGGIGKRDRRHPHLDDLHA